MKFDRCIVTITFGKSFEKLAMLTRPFLEEYCHKTKADLIVWTTPDPHNHPFFKKMDISVLLSIYKEVLFIDTDILITRGAPDLFDTVPKNFSLALYEEGHLAKNGPNDKTRHLNSWVNSYKQYLSESDNSNTIDIIRNLNDGWNENYFNSGVMLCRQGSFDLFDLPIPETMIQNWFPEQDFLNYLIYHYNLDVFFLSHNFNRFPYWQEKDSREDRINSHFIHYAGVPERDKMIQLDIERR